MLILFFVIIFSSMGFGLVLPPFMFVAKNLGASEMLAGFIVSSFAMGQFLATPVWGKLSDRYGRKPILMLTMIGSLFAYLQSLPPDVFEAARIEGAGGSLPPKASRKVAASGVTPGM